MDRGPGQAAKGERRKLRALHLLRVVLGSPGAAERARAFCDRHGGRLTVRGEGLRRGRRPLGSLLPEAEDSRALLRSHSMGGRIGTRPRKGGHRA